MVGTFVHIEVTVKLSTEFVLRKHALHSVLDDADGVFLQHLSRSAEALASRIAGVVDINLVSHLLAGETDLLGIDHDDIVTTVEMRRIVSFRLAAQNTGDDGGKTAYDCIFRVDDIVNF